MLWLFALLSAPVHPVIEFLQDPVKVGGVATGLGLLGGAAIGVYTKYRKAKDELAMLAVPPTAPMPLPPPAPTAVPPSEDLTASRIRQLHLDTELAEAQAALHRLRRSQDSTAYEQAQSAKAIFELRAENERLTKQVTELTAAGAALVEEMRRLRSEPPPTPPTRPRRDR